MAYNEKRCELLAIVILNEQIVFCDLYGNDLFMGVKGLI
jgi:hypothetical protein